MHIAMDGNSLLAPIMHQLSHYRDCDKILKWLIRNKIVGFNLFDWLKIEHQNSLMSMVKFIVKSHNKDREEKPIILNKDWIA